MHHMQSFCISCLYFCISCPCVTLENAELRVGVGLPAPGMSKKHGEKPICKRAQKAEHHWIIEIGKLSHRWCFSSRVILFFYENVAPLEFLVRLQLVLWTPQLLKVIIAGNNCEIPKIGGHDIDFQQFILSNQ